MKFTLVLQVKHTSNLHFCAIVAVNDLAGILNICVLFATEDFTQLYMPLQSRQNDWYAAAD